MGRNCKAGKELKEAMKEEASLNSVFRETELGQRPVIVVLV